MNQWIEKNGYDTFLLAAAECLNTADTEVHLVRFREGKFCHYHRQTTELFYFTAGTGVVVLDDREMRLSPGVSVLIKPYVRHTFINHSDTEPMEAVMIKTNAQPNDTHCI
jgi:mannose-6-phosphate isomerase-like protein (cupin superfamily)